MQGGAQGHHKVTPPNETQVEGSTVCVGVQRQPLRESRRKEIGQEEFAFCKGIQCMRIGRVLYSVAEVATLSGLSCS